MVLSMKENTNRDCFFLIIYNGNRTEWSPIRSVIIWVINKIGWTWSRSPICQSRVWLQTELDEKKSRYHSRYNFQKQQIHLGQMSHVDVSSKKTSPFWKFLNYFLGLVVVVMVIVINSVIGGLGWVDLVWLASSTVHLQMSDYSHMSDYTVQLQLYRIISEK